MAFLVNTNHTMSLGCDLESIEPFRRECKLFLLLRIRVRAKLLLSRLFLLICFLLSSNELAFDRKRVPRRDTTHIDRVKQLGHVCECDPELSCQLELRHCIILKLVLEEGSPEGALRCVDALVHEDVLSIDHFEEQGAFSEFRTDDCETRAFWR